jgi:hypothetical protein
MNAKGFTISVMMRKYVDYVMRCGLRATVSFIQPKNPYTIHWFHFVCKLSWFYTVSLGANAFLFVASCTHQRPPLQREVSQDMHESPPLDVL